jgi:hypothetical protein
MGVPRVVPAGDSCGHLALCWAPNCNWMLQFAPSKCTHCYFPSPKQGLLLTCCCRCYCHPSLLLLDITHAFHASYTPFPAYAFPPNTIPVVLQAFQQYSPLNLMRPSAVRLACVIMPLYSTVSTSSAGANRPSSIKPLRVTVPAGRLGALRTPGLGAGSFFFRDYV